MKIFIILILLFIVFINLNVVEEGFGSFCEHNTVESCNKLTRNNCNAVKCCVWMSDDTCVAGSERGPTYNTDDNGKTKAIDFYYYQNKRYGN